MEVIVALVVVGVIGGMMTVFFRAPLQNYTSALRRAELVDIADHALRMMARDIRLALPNSVAVYNNNTLQLLQTKTAGRYLSEADGHANLEPLDFLRTSATTFTAIGDVPSGRQAIANGDYLVVNNLGASVLPGDAYQAAGYNRAVITGTGTTSVAHTYTISLASNPFAQQDPPIPSPGSRFHVVSGPVAYQCIGGANGTGTLRRYSAYGIVSGQPALSGGALLANNITSCTFTYGTVNARLSMVSLSLTIASPDLSTEPVTLTHQVHF